MKVHIYALIDPVTKLVRYVGKSVNVKHRFWAHICTLDPHTHRGRWIATLRKAGLVPLVDILEEIDDPEDNKWKAREIYWIKWMRSEGYDLTNIKAGGGGTPLPGTTRERLMASFTPERRAKIAARNVARIWKEETLAKKRGMKFTEEHKSKLRAAFTSERLKLMSLRGRNRKRTPEEIAKTVARILGTKWSPMRRAKMEATWTDEKRAQFAVQLRSVERKNTPETIAMMSESSRRRNRSELTGQFL